MIEILKGLIDLILMGLHAIFFIEIPLYDDHSIYFGMLILAVAFIVICIIIFCHTTGIGMGDDD